MAASSRCLGESRRLLSVWVLCGLVIGPGIAGQTTPMQTGQQSAGPVAQPQGQETTAVRTGTQAGAFAYNPEGRRDPFVSLVTRGFDSGGVRRQGKPAEGVAGMAVAELILKGVFQSRGHYVAIVQGPDNRSYNVRVNDRLYDGFVRAITPSEIVLIQEVNDPLSVSKQREVRKPLRASSEPK